MPALSKLCCDAEFPWRRVRWIEPADSPRSTRVTRVYSNGWAMSMCDGDGSVNAAAKLTCSVLHTIPNPELIEIQSWQLWQAASCWRDIAGQGTEEFKTQGCNHRCISRALVSSLFRSRQMDLFKQVQDIYNDAKVRRRFLAKIDWWLRS